MQVWIRICSNAEIVRLSFYYAFSNGQILYSYPNTVKICRLSEEQYTKMLYSADRNDGTSTDARRMQTHLMK